VLYSFCHASAQYGYAKCDNGITFLYFCPSLFPFLQIVIIGVIVIVWRVVGKLSGLYCAVLCVTIVHSVMHTHLNKPNSCLLLRFSFLGLCRVRLFVYMCFCCVRFSFFSTVLSAKRLARKNVSKMIYFVSSGK